MAQAGSPVTSSSRLAQFLAPLPPAVEPVETQRYRRDLQQTASAAWRTHLRHFHVAEYEFNRASMCRAIAFDSAEPEELAVAEAESFLARKRLILAVDKQMKIPAPTIEALRWKWRWRDLDGGRPAWKTGIDDDEARLGRAG